MPIFSKRHEMRRLSAESDEDSKSSTATLTDFWSAGTSSIDDGSSSRGSSMPWAAEAIEQNRRDWLQIDEILYGERELPKNERLRQELLEWRERFPHIRTRGRAVGRSNINSVQISPSRNDEEVLAIDPLPRKSFLRRFQPNQLDSHVPLNSSANRFVNNTSHLLEKCLRITSSPWSKRPSVTSDQIIHHDSMQDSSFSSAIRVKSVRSDIHRQSDFAGKSDASYGRTFSSSNVELKAPLHQNESTKPLLRFRRPPVPFIDVRSNGNWSESRSTAGRSSRLTLPPIQNQVSQNSESRSHPSNIQINDLLITARSVSALQHLPRRI